MKMMQSLVEAQDEYIKLLGEEIDSMAPIAVAHGWETTRRESGAQARVKISMARASAEKPCTWTEDRDGNWVTGCDNLFILTDGTPSENGMQFCPMCGKRISNGDEKYPNANL